jgi:hypothetical protein
LLFLFNLPIKTLANLEREVEEERFITTPTTPKQQLTQMLPWQ